MNIEWRNIMAIELKHTLKEMKMKLEQLKGYL